MITKHNNYHNNDNNNNNNISTNNDINTINHTIYVCMCIYIYIYIYIHDLRWKEYILQLLNKLVERIHLATLEQSIYDKKQQIKGKQPSPITPGMQATHTR